jgi:acyl-coenzyme A synthetase/AMP-(fatty) acid ligase
VFLLRKIHESAVADPGKLALAYDDRAIAYGPFWRLIEACRRSLQPLLPDHGIAVVSVDNPVEGWILSLALRGLGLNATVTRIPEQVALFEGQDVACVISLVSEQRAPGDTPTGARLLSLADPSRQPISDREPLPPPPDDLRAGGQILLTSGTTGESKKVLSKTGGTQESVNARVESYRELGEKYRQQGPDTILNLFSLGLWTGAGHLWPVMTWSLGGAVVLHGEANFEKALEWPGLTHTRTTPAYLTALMAMPEGAFPYLPEMQLTVVSGGLTPAMTREIRSRLTPRILITLSATEGGGFARTIIETDEDLRWYRLVPDRVVEVVDDNDTPLPPGELGRLRVRQQEVSGYLDDPETTAKFFSDGWFYPGDMAVLDGKGRVALYGRTTDIVHIRGNKLPAAPWERAIQEALECEGVCVLSGSWRSEAEQLHLFIESRRPISNQALADAVRTHLSGFPGVHIHLVQALPRTPTGKIRRITLAQQLHGGVYGKEA